MTMEPFERDKLYTITLESDGGLSLTSSPLKAIYREALRQKKAAEIEHAKIEHDKHEAASYAIQLNRSRKEFETKLQLLKLRKGTLATQIAAAL